MWDFSFPCFVSVRWCFFFGGWLLLFWICGRDIKLFCWIFCEGFAFFFLDISSWVPSKKKGCAFEKFVRVRWGVQFSHFPARSRPYSTLHKRLKIRRLALTSTFFWGERCFWNMTRTVNRKKSFVYVFLLLFFLNWRKNIIVVIRRSGIAHIYKGNITSQPQALAQC